MEEDIRIIQQNVATYRRLRGGKTTRFPGLLLEQIKFVGYKHKIPVWTLFTKFLGAKNIGCGSRKRLANIKYNKYCELFIISDELMKSLTDEDYINTSKSQLSSFNLEGRTFLNPQINELIETLKLMIAEEDLKIKIYNEMKSLIENK